MSRRNESDDEPRMSAGERMKEALRQLGYPPTQPVHDASKDRARSERSVRAQHAAAQLDPARHGAPSNEERLPPGAFKTGKPFYAAPPGLPNELPRSYWSDPLDGLPGAVLGADEIAFYCSLFGMIRPFDEGQLRSASYALTLGDVALVGGETLQLTADAPTVNIPARGNATLVPAEVLLVPHYLVGRIGLTISLVHRGLLVGAGPQVDPGYQGALSCPVYNMTDKPIGLLRGDRLLRIDFARTGGLARETRDRLWDVDSEDELYASQQLGVDGRAVPLFPRERRWRDPLTGY